MAATEILRQCAAVERCTSELPDHIKSQQIWYVKLKTVCQNLLAQCEADARTTTGDQNDPEVRLRLQEIEAAKINVEQLLKSIEYVFHPELFEDDGENEEEGEVIPSEGGVSKEDSKLDVIVEEGGVEGEDSIVSPKQQVGSPGAKANRESTSSPLARARSSGTGRNLTKQLRKQSLNKKQNDRAGLFGDYGGSSSMDYEGERSKLEDDMMDSVAVMNKVAKGMHSAIQKDLKQLEQTTDLMDKEGDSLSKQQKTGEEVYAASSFDFFRTLFFLAVSVVVYVLMVIFIISSGFNPLNFIPIIR